MQRLNRGMMGRYEIPDHIPQTLRAVLFGLGEGPLGTVLRLIDGGGLDLGVACLHAGDPLGALLAEQDGLYTTFVRGYLGETHVHREEVVQAITRVCGPEDIEALAAEPALALGILDTEAGEIDDLLDLAARLLSARRAAGLGGLEFLCLGETADCAARARESVVRRAPDLSGWLDAACAFFPALADGLALRAEAREAARLCAEMNYADGMIHLAEPGARLWIQAPEDFRRRWPLDRAEGVAFTDDLAGELALKHRLFDAGLFAMAAPGWLLGCDTLDGCMKLERLRDFVGRTYVDELLPGLDREAAAPRVIRAFERFENPLNRSAILRAGAPLLRRFRLGALPVIRAVAEETFEPPRRLAFALAATIMLYAGARPNAQGVWEVARGSESQPILDDPEALAVFGTLAHDMPPETLAYAALADRTLWDGEDLRGIDGLEARVALDIARLQRDPAYLPGNE